MIRMMVMFMIVMRMMIMFMVVMRMMIMFMMVMGRILMTTMTMTNFPCSLAVSLVFTKSHFSQKNFVLEMQQKKYSSLLRLILLEVVKIFSENNWWVNNDHH